jgi:hypothetical protein
VGLELERLLPSVPLRGGDMVPRRHRLNRFCLVRARVPAADPEAECCLVVLRGRVAVLVRGHHSLRRRQVRQRVPAAVRDANRRPVVLRAGGVADLGRGPGVRQRHALLPDGGFPHVTVEGRTTSRGRASDSQGGEVDEGVPQLGFNVLDDAEGSSGGVPRVRLGLVLDGPDEEVLVPARLDHQHQVLHALEAKEPPHVLDGCHHLVPGEVAREAAIWQAPAAVVLADAARPRRRGAPRRCGPDSRERQGRGEGARSRGWGGFWGQGPSALLVAVVGRRRRGRSFVVAC